MNILHVTPSFHPASHYGGPSESHFQLCMAEGALGHDVLVLTTNANGPHRVLPSVPGHVRDWGKGVRAIYCPRQLLEDVSFRLFRLLPRYVRWADVVHLNAVYSPTTLPTLAVARWYGKPCVWTPRGALSRWPLARHRAIKRAFEIACAAVLPRRVMLHFTSEEERRQAGTRIDAPSVVVPNAVTIPATPASKTASGVFRLLYLGRLHPIKGIENLIEACALINEEDVGPWQLTLAGDGEPEFVASLRERVGRLGLDDRVRFAGFVDGTAKADLFNNSDALILPSHSENFGMVVAEALSWRTPVIASRGTPWSALEQEGCGLWVDNSPRALADAMARIRKMPLDAMGTRGAAWMSRDFQWRDRATAMIETYAALAERA